MRRFSLLLALALLTSCAKGTPERATQAAEPLGVKVAQADLALFDAVGDAAPLVVAVRPEQWGALHGSLTALVRDLPLPLPPVIQQAKSIEAAVGLLGSKLAAPLDLGALDATRPIVLGLFEPFTDGPPGTISTHPALAEMRFPGFRHRAALPARDPKALITALQASLAGLGTPDPERAKAHPGGHAWRLPEGWALIWPAEGHVAVEVVTHVVGAPEQALAPQAPAAAATRTPALLALAARSSGVLVRSWRLRPAWAAFGLFQGVSALRSVSGSNRDRLATAAQGLILSGEAWMNDLRADFDDHALLVSPFDQGLQLHVVSSLGADGQRAIQAASATLGGPFPVKNARAMATLWTGLDLDALVRAAKVPALVGHGRVTPQSLMESARECGPGCLQHAVLRQPFAMLAAIKALLEGKGMTVGALPRGMHLLVVGPQQMALALNVPALFNESALRALLPKMPQLSLTSTQHQDRRSLFISVGDASAMFDPTPGTSTLDAMGGARLDLQGVAHSIEAQQPKIAAWLRTLAPVVLGHRVEGNALVLRLVVHRAASRPPEDAPLGLGTVTWPSPVKTDASTTCLVHAASTVSVGLQGVRYATADDRARLLVATLSEAEAQLDCAAKDHPKLVANLRALVLLPAAKQEMDAWRYETAGRILAQACTKGIAEACARQKALAKVPQPVLPTVTAQCDRTRNDVVARLDIPAEGPLRLDHQPVSPGDLQARLTEAAYGDTRPAKARGRGALLLAMHPKADVGRLAAVWTAAQRAGLRAVRVAMLQNGRLAGLDLPLAPGPNASHVDLAELALTEADAVVLHVEPSQVWGPLVTGLTARCGQPSLSFEPLPGGAPAP